APLFERAAVMTPEAIQSELAAIKARGKARETVATLPLLETELQRLRAGREAYQARFETWLAGYKPPSPEELRRIERTRVRQEVAEPPARLGRPLTPAKYDVLADRYLEDVEYPVSGEPAAGARAEQDQGETVNQAAEHWFAEMQRPDAGVPSQTLDG